VVKKLGLTLHASQIAFTNASTSPTDKWYDGMPWVLPDIFGGGALPNWKLLDKPCCAVFSGYLMLLVQVLHQRVEASELAGRIKMRPELLPDARQPMPHPDAHIFCRVPTQAALQQHLDGVVTQVARDRVCPRGDGASSGCVILEAVIEILRTKLVDSPLFCIGFVIAPRLVQLRHHGVTCLRLDELARGEIGMCSKTILSFRC
jgi:hypothetical protein